MIIFPAERDGDGERVLNYTEKEKALAFLKSEYAKEEIIAGKKTQDKEKKDNPIPNIQLEHSMFDIAKRVRESKRLNMNDLNDSEISSYLDEDLSLESQCPLSFWRSKASKYPILSNLAKKFLAIPASSGGVERVFSIAGSITRARRAKIYSQNLEDVILLRQHRKGSIIKRLRDSGKKIYRKRKPCRRQSFASSSSTTN